MEGNIISDILWEYFRQRLLLFHLCKCSGISKNREEWSGVDDVVRGTVGDTQGVGGLCLPWGFHAVQTSTSGMSRNQTHWLLLNWPRWAAIGSSGGQLSENTAFAIYSPFAAAYNCHPVSAPRHTTDTVTHPIRATLAVPRHRKNNSSPDAQWEPVMMRRPCVLETVMTDRWEKLHLGLILVSQPSYWSGKSNCMLSLFLRGAATVGPLSTQLKVWQMTKPKR